MKYIGFPSPSYPLAVRLKKTVTLKKTNNMTANSILYFPSIEFHSDEWVKSSLLLWDNVYRIVPADYKPRDNNSIREFVDCELVRNITLDANDVKQTGDEFLELCQSLPFIPAGLEPSDEDRIHPDKIDKRLYPSLDKIADNFLHDGWLHLSKELARGYMFYLAKTVAKRRNLVRGTNDSDSWSVAPYFTEQANFDDFMCNEEAEGFYCSLLLEDLIPRNIGSVPAKDIIRFVEKRKELKEQLRIKLDLLFAKLALIENKDQAFVEVNDFISQVEYDKKELRKSMDFWRSGIQSSLFAVGVPTTLTALGAFGLSGDPFAAKKIAGSIMIGAVASYTDYKKTVKTDRDSSYASYLIQVDKLAKPDLPYELMRNLEEFIND